jgi:hypothetical protein
VQQLLLIDLTGEALKQLGLNNAAVHAKAAIVQRRRPLDTLLQTDRLRADSGLSSDGPDPMQPQTAPESRHSSRWRAAHQARTKRPPRLGEKLHHWTAIPAGMHTKPPRGPNNRLAARRGV